MRGNDFRGHSIKAAIIVGEVTYSFSFCFLSLAMAEHVYENIFCRKGDINRLLDDLSDGSTNWTFIKL